jgi:hypothetical protein
MAPSTQERPPTRIAHDSRIRNPLSDGSGSDYHIAYQVFGEGPTDIVFCPEWFNNIDMWWDEPRVVRFLDRLASFSRVIVFDKRGTGISDPVPLDRDPVLETWMDDVARVMDYAGSKEATLFGHRYVSSSQRRTRNERAHSCCPTAGRAWRTHRTTGERTSP